MGDADVGEPLGPDGGGIAFADKTVQIEGAFDSATVVIQGSNDGTNWFTLTNPAGADISTGVDTLEAILENPIYIRPSTSGGLGSAVINVILSGRATLQLR